MGTVLVVPKMDIPSIKKATRTVPPVLPGPLAYIRHVPYNDLVTRQC